jgi:hypothetical protein
MRICVHLRVAVTVNSLLETDELRQSYEIKKKHKFQTAGRRNLVTKWRGNNS